jgi:hypothetical protein
MSEWQERIQAQGWKPVKNMPRDGRWIIAVCNDGVSVHRISWGVARNGKVAWCEADRAIYYGDPSGLFAGWIDCPQPRVDGETAP